MSTASLHSVHSAASDHGEAVAAPRKLWTADNPFFDNLTMSAIVLDRLQQHIRFEDGPLHCLQAKGQVPSMVTTTCPSLSLLTFQDLRSTMMLTRRRCRLPSLYVILLVRLVRDELRRLGGLYAE